MGAVLKEATQHWSSKKEGEQDKSSPNKAVTKIELVSGTSLYNYTKENRVFMKIFLTSPKYISSCE